MDPTAALGADPQLEAPPTGRLILGLDKRNPVFAVHEDDSGKRLLVFYGFELIEIVNNNPAAPAFRLLLARLYNSGVKLSAMCESFEVDPKTIRRWGKALRQGDPVELVRVLEGRGAGRKLTGAIKVFQTGFAFSSRALTRSGSSKRCRGGVRKCFQRTEKPKGHRTGGVARSQGGFGVKVGQLCPTRPVLAGPWNSRESSKWALLERTPRPGI